MKRYIYLISLSLLSLFSCTSEKDIDILIPDFESSLVVECYLEPGKPYKLALTESVSYFEQPSLPQVKDALVIITYQGITDTLAYEPTFDETNKFYNYLSDKIVPEDYTSPFTLYIKDGYGREIRGTTTILKPVMIDTIEFVFNDVDRAYPQLSFKDNITQENYYRYLVRRSNEIIIDISIDDKLIKTENVILGGAYRLNRGDGIDIKLIHMDKSYFDFIQSVGEAQSSNGNPFGQPSKIRSNVQGGIGIFTGLSYDKRFAVAD